MPLRLGFFGAGLIARYHASSLRAGGADAVIAAVFDPDRARAAAFAGEVGAVIAVDETAVLDRSDAVYVCTWTSEHPRLVTEAAARGLAVFCEKPLATDLAGAEAMCVAVDAAAVTNQAGLVLRSAPGFVLLRRLLADPAAGRLMTVIFRDDQQLPLGGAYGSTWRVDRRRAGAGTLLEHSIHDLDLMEWLCGPIQTVSAHSANFHDFDGIEDSVAVAVRFACGATGVLTSTWHDLPGRPSCRRLEVFTERARFEAEGNAAEAVRWEHGPGAQHERLGPHDQRVGLGPLAPANADAAFVASAAARTPASPDFAVALRAHRLVDAVYRSAAAGGAAVTVGAAGATGVLPAVQRNAGMTS